jgi:hypothetical protein
MYNTSGNGIDHSKNRLNPVSMGRKKKGTSVANNAVMPIPFLSHKLPHLREFTFKADKLKVSGYEASGVEVTYKFQAPKPQVIKTHQIKKEKTLWDKLWLFVVKQSLSSFFQIVIKHFQQFIP